MNKKIKICNECKIPKELKEFSKRSANKDGYSNKCKKCEYEKNKESYYRTSGERNKYIINRRRKLAEERNELILSLDLKCERCGFNHIAALDFHHIDPKKKTKNVSTLKWSGCSNETFLNEIKKCIVLCSNCHRIEHFKKL